MQFKVLSLLSPSAPVVSDAASVLASIHRITEAAVDFNKTLTDWNGGITGALSILSKSGGLIRMTNSGAETVNASDPLTVKEAQKIAVAAQELANLLGKAIDTAIARKPHFDTVAFFGSFAGEAILQRLRSASTVLHDALTAKAPAEMIDAATYIFTQIDGHFSREEIIIVTGGSTGIGGELVRQLEGLGPTIVVMDIVPPTFKVGDKTHYFRANVASFNDVASCCQRVVAKLGAPTILVANAGIVKGKTVLDASEQDLRATFDVNVLGVLFCIKACLPFMIAADRGHILITSSITAFSTLPSVVDYCASKAAVTSVVEGLQTELKHKYGNPRIKVSAIFPGTVATKMFEYANQPLNGFIFPVLRPRQVADQMLKILLNGKR
ncbi:cation chloride cotransporter [Purpureocillium lavendulum]|uniref:Cation chloride cotransporter n=1 Tax=Purpureocillium lavendulum TaxID=1247861 RepID=A0AB34FJ17_9HYPO|nr:cation chloride cotransporter [Purpureocillium lavendulum]